MLSASKTFYRVQYQQPGASYEARLGNCSVFAIAIDFIASLRSSALILLRDPIILNVYELNALSFLSA